MEGRPLVTVVGGGLAGVEASWAAAVRGAQVLLYEMRPQKLTPAHQTGELAEIVCSNSFKSALLTNASGLLKEEMRRLGSALLPIADQCAVPAGEALAVDRSEFAAAATLRLRSHPEITLIREEVVEPPEDRPAVIATGPLTSDSMVASLASMTGRDLMRFYDAVAPTVTLESLNLDRVFRAARRGRSLTPTEPSAEPPDDYLNCPFSREEYEAFHRALVEAEAAAPHLEEERSARFFEACVPVEELARRGPRTLAFGPMRPIGLTDPRTGRRPFAVVQLRQENREGTLWGLVGFQTRLKWGDQRRIFRMIPGLENAEFARYGVMHRNTYIESPSLLAPTLEMRREPGLFVAGQLTGVEGYLESAATGMLAGINAVRQASGADTVLPPAETVVGALCRYIAETAPDRFAPMNANHGLLPPLADRPRDRKLRGMAYAERSLTALDAWIRAQRIGPDDP